MTKTVFCSGSCRLLLAITHSRDRIRILHGLVYNFVGVNFLGKLHNTKQHLQFIKFLKGEVDIPVEILARFLTSYSCLEKFRLFTMEDPALLPIKRKEIMDRWESCEWFIFEICSLKRYRKDGYEVQYELTEDYDEVVVQTAEELRQDLAELRAMIPAHKKILFQTHFRLDVIHQDASQRIEARETIYRGVHAFCERHDNTYVYDPSSWLQSSPQLFQWGTHFVSPQGLQKSADYIYQNYIFKYS